jgi:hypothetical protein
MSSISASRTVFAVVALATVTLIVVAACVIGAANAANASSAERHPGFGAAARVAVDQAAARLAPGQPATAGGQQGHAAQ